MCAVPVRYARATRVRTAKACRVQADRGLHTFAVLAANDCDKVRGSKRAFLTSSSPDPLGTPSISKKSFVRRIFSTSCRCSAVPPLLPEGAAPALDAGGADCEDAGALIAAAVSDKVQGDDNLSPDSYSDEFQARNQDVLKRRRIAEITETKAITWSTWSRRGRARDSVGPNKCCWTN